MKSLMSLLFTTLLLFSSASYAGCGGDHANTNSDDQKKEKKTGAWVFEYRYIAD